MNKLKKLLCCLWSTPTAIFIATILYLYADRNEYIYLTNINKEDEFGDLYEGEVIQVTNKWTGNTCLALTTFKNSYIVNSENYKFCIKYWTKDL